MDIDDILAEATSTPQPDPSQDLRALTRHWVNERCSPELLPWPRALVDRVVARMGAQMDEIERRTGDAADGVERAAAGGAGGGGAGVQGAASAGSLGFALVVLQTEMERCKFLVRSLLRARLAKIDAQPLYYSTDGPSTRLSRTEVQYLNAHQFLMSNHYSASFLGQFPAQLQKLDDTSGGTSMIETPDSERAVFVRALKDVGTIALPGDRVQADVRKGDIWVLRWSAVKELVESADMELI